MREAFHGELAELGEHLAAMAGQAADSMQSATQAVITGDGPLAERVIAADFELDAAGHRCEDHAQRLLALQAPVAGDLRTVLASLFCAVKIERMGDLVVHLADLVRFSRPEPVVPDDLANSVEALGELTVTMANRLPELIRDAGTASFSVMEETDDAVDALCARLGATVRSEHWRHGVPAAVNLALLIRFYERFADQTVSVARRLEFATTGTLPG